MNDREAAIGRAKREAYRLLASRSRTAHELRDRLQQRGHKINDIDQVIYQLVHEGYLDDRKFAFDWARYRLQEKPLGRRRLSWEIQRRGINSELLEEVLNDIYAEFDQVALAEQALRKRLRIAGIPRSVYERQKLSRYLVSLGFDGDIIATALTTVLGSVIPIEGIAGEDLP
ncbi:MAG TPA: regulatory protein RecX [Gammaproteobacteria bacterium]|jgi:regulatory protein|nr:regulatory protein RecX [Gammaproteobacteria bacterium]